MTQQPRLLLQVNPQNEASAMLPTMKEVAVLFNASPAGQRLLELAARLAAEQEALLCGLYVPDLNGNGSHGEFSKSALHALEQVGLRNGVDTVLTTLSQAQTESAEFLLTLTCDLLVLGGSTSVPQAWVSGSAFLHAGLAVLFVPAQWSGELIGWHVAMAWHDNRHTRRAMADALPLLVIAQSVDLLITPPATGRSADTAHAGEEAAGLLARNGPHVSLYHLPTRPRLTSLELLEHARQRGSDLMVLAATTPAGALPGNLLASAPLPVFISH